MFEKIFKNINLIKETDFEYYDLKDNHDVSINFIDAGKKILPHSHDQWKK